MAIKIDKKIVGYKVMDNAVKEDSKVPNAAPVVEDKQDIIQMHERLERPETLIGTTYKIKTPIVEHAMYITINDITLNIDSEHEHRRPFEIFINSKNMDQFQWIVALTRILSAVFRKGGDISFLVEEMKSVFDPKGGYFKKGGVYMPSIIAEIGHVVEKHLISIGMMQGIVLSEEQKALIESKKKALAAKKEETETSSFPDSATLCDKCNNKSLVIMDGCATCLNCGYSKCG